ncbi:Hok/Gef family protein [Kluyvera sichuanensis]
MLDTYRLASYPPKGKEMLAMKQQSWRFITLIIICITVVMVVLITRKDLCEVRLKTGQTEVAVLRLTNPSKSTGGESSPPLFMCWLSSWHPQT